ncbi:MAG: hypothetical protein AAF492_03250, partial [Verrucomicrobiota bacterium]
MKPFAFKLVLFAFPWLLLIGGIGLVFFAAEETVSPDRAIQKQTADRSIIYGPAYSNPNPSYKFKAAVARKPEVLALGTSRVMQFRSWLFTQKPDAFYNAGGAVTKLPDIQQFLALIEPDPKVILLGLDHYFFNPAWDPLNSPNGDIEAHARRKQSRIVRKSKRVVLDYAKRAYTLR